MKKIITGILLLMVILAGFGCKQEQNEAKTTSNITYTCPMHPQIVQVAEGTCPICFMDLVPVDRNSDEASLMLGERQRLLANITTDTVKVGAFFSEKELNGRVVLDPKQVEYITSRVPGRIEELYVKETGVVVRKGQALYRIYSEQLSTIQQEYLVALAQSEQFPDNEKFKSILDATKQRLLLYDQSPKQIEELRTTRKVNPYVAYSSPTTGSVAELFVNEGQYVPEGGSVIRLEGYQTVWVEADIYPSEAGKISKGQMVMVTIPGFEGKSTPMKIEFIEPALQTGSQLLTLRGSLQNSGNDLRPGIQVLVKVPFHTVAKATTLPVDAVIREGKGAHIWLETEPGKFQARSVKLGPENFNRVEITDGLKEGEVAVTSGAYLLYSEYVLKKGRNPVGAHQH